MVNQFRLVIVGFIALFYLISCENSEHTINAEIQSSKLQLTGAIGSSVKSIEIHLYSDRNQQVSSYNEISQENPDTEELKDKIAQRDWNIIYPVVDIALTETMKAQISFDQTINSSFSTNAMFHQELFELVNGKASIPAEYLQHWENNIYINNSSTSVSKFLITDQPEFNVDLDIEYTLLSPNWSGDLFLIDQESQDTLFTKSFIQSPSNPQKGTLKALQDSGLDKARLLKSLAATINFTLGCQDASPNGKTKNGLNLFYDLEAKTYRRPTWVWGTGPSIKLLLESGNYPELVEKFGKDRLVTKAKEIGEVALPLQIKDSSSPAHGVVISRWSENKGTLEENYGFEEYYSVADAQFFVGWGWIPLYKETNDSRFLEGARLMTSATDRLTKEFDLTPMDYMVRAEKWKNYALNEQGFGTEGINELFKVDPNPGYQRIGHEYMQMLLKKFDTESGIWNRLYRIEQQKAEPTRYHTRGVGWAMEGLIAVYELTKKPIYLEKAVKMGNHLIENQLADGSWSYDFKSRNPNEISEKGTALWSLLFYKLYAFTKNPVHLEAARKALLWCLNNQYDGEDLNAHGGVIGVSRQSGVIYRHWFPLACTYTSGFFGLAVIEELKIQENES